MKNDTADTIPSVTMPTDIKMATFLVGFVGCAVIELAVALAFALAASGGGGGSWVGAGDDPLGSSGKKGSSGLGNPGMAGGGGGGGGGSVAGGGVVLAGKRGWWRILLMGWLFCC